MESNIQKDQTLHVQLCSFYLADRLFGVNIIDVREINADIKIAPIHHSLRAIRGYINLRGQIHLVVDMATLFGFKSRDVTHESKIIIFKNSVGEAFGILVDKVADVTEVENRLIEDRRKKKKKDGKSSNAKELRKADSELTVGVCKLEKGLMVVLDSSAILRSLENHQINK